MRSAHALLLATLVVGCTRTSGNAKLPPQVLDTGARKLTAAEAELSAKNGFVLSTEEVASFHVGYTSVFRSHHPVYFTADALLHAWHASYDDILLQLEKAALAPELTVMLEELRGAVAKSSATPETRADVALYLDVAFGLLTGKPTTKAADALVKHAEAAAGMAELPLFGDKLLVDLSMLKPRGHYTQSPELQRYFRASMWLGRTELRFAQKDPKGEAWVVNKRAFEGVKLLRAAVTPRAEKAWRAIDDATRVLVGPPDSMSLPGFDRAHKGLSPTAGDDAIGKAFEVEANQKIGSQLLHPRVKELSFLPLGQRYVFDSHVFSAVTYGALKSYRMMPNPLDVGWAVFGNPAARRLLGPELEKNPEYAAALEGIAKEGAGFGPDLWQTSVYHLWLSAIRELSPSAEADKVLPAPMQSDAWSRRLLNAQLASWAELRHDNLLYAKQSFTAMAACEYPDAYVDPYPAFYAAMARLGDKGVGLVDLLPLAPDAAKKVRAYFTHLREVSTKLREIAEQERRGEALTSAQLDFMNHMVSIDGRHGGCATVLEAHGWYADLHYHRDGALHAKPTIADVHTQPTDEVGNPVGKVLHVATGRPRLFSVTLSGSSGATCTPREYRGFVSSYDEVVTSNFARLSDEEWWQKITKEKAGKTITATPVDVPWLADLVAR
ncbi:MAG: DUF3160 domain-containing protein [Myxococcales bacterium]|nr:DUF3160 domain-containing protein [Myxococcales bacterium]